MLKLLKSLVPQSIKEYVRARRAQLGLGILPFQYYQSHAQDSEFVITDATSQVDRTIIDGLPVAPLKYRQGYNKEAERFVAGGKNSVDSMIEIIRRSQREIPQAPILDFGCGAGRMIRHFVDHARSHEVWGVDVNAEYIQWCIENLQPPFLFATTSLLHSLPFEDNYFGLIYAGSVFTHTEDLTSCWLAELRRVLKPGGLLYITIHDEACIKVNREEFSSGGLWQQLAASRSYQKHKDDFNVIVLGRRVMSNVYYKREYFLSKYIRTMFNEVSVTDRAYGNHQTAVLAEKRVGRS